IQDRFAPPAVVVDSDLQIVQFRGQTGPFLEPAPGDPSLSVLKMAREGLLYGLRTALQEARRGERPVRRDRLRVRDSKGWRTVSLEVIPLLSTERPHYLVLFYDQTDDGRPRPKTNDLPAVRAEHKPKKTDTRLERLHHELASSREYLQS